MCFGSSSGLPVNSGLKWDQCNCGIGLGWNGGTTGCAGGTACCAGGTGGCTGWTGGTVGGAMGWLRCGWSSISHIYLCYR